MIGASGLTIERLIAEGTKFESTFTEPEDWVEGVDAPELLDPPSIYEDQLARRIDG